jgi:hypothetical protein
MLVSIFFEARESRDLSLKYVSLSSSRDLEAEDEGREQDMLASAVLVDKPV